MKKIAIILMLMLPAPVLLSQQTTPAGIPSAGNYESVWP